LFSLLPPFSPLSSSLLSLFLLSLHSLSSGRGKKREEGRGRKREEEEGGRGRKREGNRGKGTEGRIHILMKINIRQPS
jgi:hypothetical protein